MTEELTGAPEGAGDAPVSDAGGQTGASEAKIDRSAEVTPRPSIDRAFEKAFAEDEPDQTPEPVEADAKGGQDRDEKTGRFKAKDADSAKPEEAPADKPEDKGEPGDVQPPNRFSAEAKEAWKAAPPAVRSEVLRMERELVAGIEKHRESAAKWEDLKEFRELAEKHGTDIKTALTNYVAAERELGRDIVAGLDRIAQGFGVSLRQIAEHVVGQKPDEARAKDEQTIRELRAEIDGLKKEFGGVTTTIQQQRDAEVRRTVEAFAKDHPRFEELAPEIEHALKTGYAKDLAEAYAIAELRKPAPATAKAEQTQAAEAKTDDRREQIDKGRLSTSGAPGSGSNPATRKPASSAGEAVERALASAGF